MSLFHIKTQTVPDSTATSLVRPSDWNSAHAQAMTISGNTAGQSTFSGTNIVFQGGNNVTLSANTAAGAATVIVSAAGGAAGAGTGFTSTTTAGTAVVGTLNSNGLSMGVPAYLTTAQPVGAYLTTAAQSNHSHAFATTTTNGANIVVGTTNSNGVTIGVPAYLTTAQPVGAYLTTARASNDAVGLNTAATNVTWTVNSNGISLNAGGYLTTAAQSNHSHGNPTLNLTNLSGTTASNSAGFTLSLSAGAGGAADGYNSAQFTNSTANSTMPLVWAGNSNGSGNVTMGLTGSTITMSAPSGAGGGAAISAGANSQSTGTVNFANSNGITFGLSNNGTMTASHNGLTQQSTQPVAYSAANGSANFSTLTFANSNGVSFSTGTQGLFATVATTYAASNHSHGNPTLALTNITGTTASASNGLTLSLSGVAAQTTQTQPAGNIAGVGTTFAGANVSGSMTLNSNGLNLSLSAPTPGGGGAINVTAGTTSGNLQTIQFDNANGVSFGLNGSTVTASVNAGGGGITESNFIPHANALWAAAQVGQNSIQVQPICNAPIVTFNRLAYAVQYSQATNSTLTVSATIQMGVYTLNGSTLSQVTSMSGSFSINGSGTASSSANSGPRWATMTLNAGAQISGDMWIAFKSSTATAGANASLSNIVASRINSTWSGFVGVGTANSVQSLPGMGFYSATSTALPNTMAISHITGNSSTAQRPQVFFLTNGALPI